MTDRHLSAAREQSQEPSDDEFVPGRANWDGRGRRELVMHPAIKRGRASLRLIAPTEPTDT